MQSSDQPVYTRADYLCSRVNAFLTRAANEKRELNFSYTGRFWERVRNVECIVYDRKGNDAVARIVFERYKWFFGYQYTGKESVPFWPIGNVVEFESATQLHVDANFMLEAVQPWKLFDKTIW